MNKKKSERSDRETQASTVPYQATARRGFFVRFMTGAVSVLLGAIPVGLGLGFFLDPLIRKRRGTSDAASGSEADSRQDDEGFIRLDVGVSSLPADGSPLACTVTNDKTDAWNRYRNVEVGTVWLRRTESDEVLAFSSVCPHLGCAIDFRKAKSDFFCPCHTSAFDLDGERTNSIPPRGMDRLEVRLKPETGDLIWLKYETFRAATPEKISVS
jgi:Rieske Fe-S protein